MIKHEWFNNASEITGYCNKNGAKLLQVIYTPDRIYHFLAFFEY